MFTHVHPSVVVGRRMRDVNEKNQSKSCVVLSCLTQANSVYSVASSKNRLNEKPGTKTIIYIVHPCILACFNAGCFRLNRSHEELTPISWHNYFENKRIVDVDGNKFTTYSLGNEESVLIVLLHGGGFNALTWSLFAVSISESYLIISEGPVGRFSIYSIFRLPLLSETLPIYNFRIKTYFQFLSFNASACNYSIDTNFLDKNK